MILIRHDFVEKNPRITLLLNDPDTSNPNHLKTMMDVIPKQMRTTKLQHVQPHVIWENITNSQPLQNTMSNASEKSTNKKKGDLEIPLFNILWLESSYSTASTQLMKLSETLLCFG